MNRTAFVKQQEILPSVRFTLVSGLFSYISVCGVHQNAVNKNMT